MRGFSLLLILAIVLGVWRGWVALPAEWNPWAPLDVRAMPNLLTRYKLARLQDDPALCDQVLATSGLRVSRQADSPADAACPLRNTLRVQGADVGLSSSFLASCPLAVAFALFERHSLQPVAQAVFGQAVTRVDHLGSFACRNVYNRAEGRLSQHATANALDIAGFRLADGRSISVLKDWPGEGERGQFLRQVRDAACKDFNVVLSPDYNAAHHNHFHLDMGRWGVCR
ncbi:MULTISPECIES: extensin family protein [Pseudomonas]|uniref:extensin-like domain-containing protein n=1 Tax=Pseudomonas TaxID=286 RepID=UPI000CFE3426|nr:MULTISPECIES: extensin family protein [Pseudomonas]PQZ95310.1 extensin [Pseudomonas trivialis]PRB30573.1 extensin [Pseudomonas sp. MYb60]